MKRLITILAFALTTTATPGFADDIKKGDKLQTLSNLHPDMQRRVMYAINYQLASSIPVCTEVTVQKISGSAMVFKYGEIDFKFELDGHTEGAGVPFQKILQTYFGPACDKAKLDALSKTDKDGIAGGVALVGMSKDGVLFAMGRPPFHANPSLEAGVWTYWRNRFAKTAIQFGSDGKVVSVK
jgi:hypothetical protein